MNLDNIIVEISMMLLHETENEFLRLNHVYSGERNYVEPTLAIITCSYDEASKIYVRNKIKKAEQVGIKVRHFDLNVSTTSTNEICNLIKSLDKLGYTGIMVQLPLDKKFDERRIIESIPPEKDVDGLTSTQRIMLEDNDENALIPCTALAVYSLISFDELVRMGCFSFSEMMDRLLTTDLSGIRVLVINRSKLIGVPLSKLLRNKNATITIAHSKTDLDINNYLKFHSVGFPYVVTGIGKNIIDCSYFKSFQTVIDCGVTKDDEGKLKRDVIINERDCFKYFGCVGKLTTTMLMYNVLKAYKSQNNYKLED